MYVPHGSNPMPTETIYFPDELWDEIQGRRLETDSSNVSQEVQRLCDLALETEARRDNKPRPEMRDAL